MKTKAILQDSALLNKPGYHTTAAAAIHLTRSGSFDNKPYISGELSISDCNRTINLDLNAHNIGEYENSLHKLLTLELLITEARTKLEEYKAKFIKDVKKAKKAARARKIAKENERKGSGESND